MQVQLHIKVHDNQLATPWPPHRILSMSPVVPGALITQNITITGIGECYHRGGHILAPSI